MKAKLVTAPLAAILCLAPLAYSQESKSAASSETKTAAQDAASAEALRQGRVAMDPNAQSPQQSMSQAIAFERYKELAAEREARKEARGMNADRSAETPHAKPVKK